jgi:LPXTG-motif cell wall-anchored protein
MDVTTLVVVGGAIVFGALYLLRRRSRVRGEDM